MYTSNLGGCIFFIAIYIFYFVDAAFEEMHFTSGQVLTDVMA
jgi:hypothetical protein